MILKNLWICEQDFMKRIFLYNQEFMQAIYKEKQKLRLEIQMVRATLFGRLEKTWAVILGSAIFLLFGELFSYHVKFYSFMFMRKIST